MKMRIGKIEFKLFDVLFDVGMLCGLIELAGDGSDVITKGFLILGCVTMSAPIISLVLTYFSEGAYVHIMNSEIKRINKETCYYNAFVTVSLAIIAFLGKLYLFSIFFSFVALSTILLNHEAYRLRLLALKALKDKQDT